MDFEYYKKEFEDKASTVGFSKENIEKCLIYAKPLLNRNLPIIYNTSHLCSLVGYNKKFIKRSVIYTSYYYRDFTIKKKNGSLRKISEPLPSLKEIQIWILKNILEKVKISAFAKAYKRKTTIKENIRFHLNQEKVVNLDIQDFFSSIKQGAIEKIFKNLGYSELVSNLLSKLCTRNFELPQGAPTSPYLSNIFFNSIDDLIASYCLPKNIRYTRFADDLTFSGSFNEADLIKFVEEKLLNFGLLINNEKTRVLKPNQRQVVTGVVVNDKMQVPFFKRNKIRQEMYYILKYGIFEHKIKQNIKQENYISHLLGKINFILHVNSSDIEFLDYKKVLVELRKTYPDC